MLSMSSDLSTVAERIRAYAAAPAVSPVWVGLNVTDGAQPLTDLHALCVPLGEVVWLRCSPPTWPGPPLHAQCLEALGTTGHAAPASELPWSPYMVAHAPAGVATDIVLQLISQLQSQLVGSEGEGKAGFLFVEDVQWLTVTDRRFLQMLTRVPQMRRAAVILTGTALPPPDLIPLDLCLDAGIGPAEPPVDAIGEAEATLLTATALYGDGMPAAFADRLCPDGGSPWSGLVERAGRLYLRNAKWRQLAVRCVRANTARARQLAGRLADLEAERGQQTACYRLAGLRARAQDRDGLATALHRLYLTTPPFDGQATAALWRRLRRLANQTGDEQTWALATSNLAFASQTRERLTETSQLITAAAAKLSQPEPRWFIRYEAAQILTRSRDAALFPAAEAHYEAAMRDLDELASPDAQASGRSAVMNGLALMSVHSGRPDEALGRELRAIQYLERLPAKGRRSSEIQDQLLTNCLRMGDVYRKRLKDYPAARYWYRRALRHARIAGQSWSAFFAYKSLGLVGADTGSYREALRDFHLAIKALEESRSYGTSRASLLVELNQVRWFAADMLYNLTRFADALRAFRAVLQSGVPLSVKSTQLLEARVQLCLTQLGETQPG